MLTVSALPKIGGEIGRDEVRRMKEKRGEEWRGRQGALTASSPQVRGAVQSLVGPDAFIHPHCHCHNHQPGAGDQV